MYYYYEQELKEKVHGLELKMIRLEKQIDCLFKLLGHTTQQAFVTNTIGHIEHERKQF